MVLESRYIGYEPHSLVNGMRHPLRILLASLPLAALLGGCAYARPAPPQQLGAYDLLRPVLSIQRQPPTLDLARSAHIAFISLRPGIGADVIYPVRGDTSRLLSAGRHPIQGMAELSLPPARRSRGPCSGPGELTFWGPPGSVYLPPQATNLRVANYRGRTVTCYRLPGTAPGSSVRQHHLLVIASEDAIVADELIERVARFNRDPVIFRAPVEELAELLSEMIAPTEEGLAWAGQMITYER